MIRDKTEHWTLFNYLFRHLINNPFTAKTGENRSNKKEKSKQKLYQLIKEQ